MGTRIDGVKQVPTVTSNLVMGNDALINRDTNAGLTASVTQTQGQGALTADVNEISVCANANDTVTLVAAAAGLVQTVINNGANTLQIFPASGDNLGAGVNASTTLEPNEAESFVAYDATNWHVAATTGLRHAEMTDSENTDAFVVSAQDDHTAYHSNGLVVGDVSGGWIYDAGGAGTSHAIASVADGAASGVDIAVTTSDAHNLAIDDIVSQSNLTSAVYTGHFKVKAIISSTIYEVAAVFTATDTGTMDQAATLKCPVGGAGTYLVSWSCDADTATNNETFDFAIHLETVHQAKTNGRSKFGTSGDVRSLSNTALLDIADGDKISWMVKNTDSAGNITVRNLHIVLVRL